MTCLSPPQPADVDLLAYLDGEPDDRVAAHLEGCPHCRERARALARLQGDLTARLYRFDCPAPAELGEYHLGLLSHDRASALTSHLAECPHCARELAQLRDYLAELSPDLELGLLEQAGAHLKLLVARLVGRGPGNGFIGQPALPSLLPHAQVAPTYAGLRGDEREPLIYEADGVQVVIEFHPDLDQPERRSILGLVIGVSEPQELSTSIGR